MSWKLGCTGDCRKETAAPVVVYVRWFDSAIYQGEACSIEDIDGICENESAGILVAEDSSSITLALDRCMDTLDVRSVLCIPRVNVRSVVRFGGS